MSDLSLEELLKTLDDAEEKQKIKPVHRDVPHMDRFLEEMNIKVGTDRVPNYIIYYTYMRVWKGVLKNDNKFSKIKFFRSLNKRLPRARDGRQRYYMVDAEAFDLSREGKAKAEHYDEWYKEKIKKKQRKVSKHPKKVQSKS